MTRIENLKKLGARASKKHSEQLLAKADTDTVSLLEDLREQESE